MQQIALVPNFVGLLSASGIPFVMQERDVFLRERRNGWYFTLSYALACYFTIVFVFFFVAFIPAITCFFMAPLNGSFWIFYLFCWGCLVCFELVAYITAAGSPHYVIAIAIDVFCQGAFMMLSGFFIWVYKIPWYLRWITYSVPNRYTFRFTMRNEFETAGNFSSEFYPSGGAVLDLFGFTDVYYWNLVNVIWVDVVIVFVFTLSYLILLFAVLKFRFR